MKTGYCTLATLIVGFALVSSPVRAQLSINCTSQITSGTFENVNVPPNATCILNGPASVLGNIIVGAGATLDLESVSIDGSILANGAALIFIDLSSIGHNINAFGAAKVEVFSNLIDGNVVVSSASFISINGNTISGNVNDQGNTTGSGASNIITGNGIGGNLVCAGNMPPPTNNGVPNTVSGKEVGQCVGL
jgi:hypothetical protein